jgi:hypothetical protein
VTASEMSLASLRGTVAQTAPVDGSMLSSTAPDRAGWLLPSIRFSNVFRMRLLHYSGQPLHGSRSPR